MQQERSMYTTCSRSSTGHLQQEQYRHLQQEEKRDLIPALSRGEERPHSGIEKRGAEPAGLRRRGGAGPAGLRRRSEIHHSFNSFSRNEIHHSFNSFNTFATLVPLSVG